MNLEKTLRHGALLGVFLLPFIVLIFWSNLFFPYIVGKNFVFRIIVEVIFALWMALALFDTRYRPRCTLLIGAIAAFIGVVALADVFGAHPYKSFWSNFERMEGLVTLLHLLAYVVVAGAVLNTEKLWLWFWRVSIAVSTMVSIQAIGQLVLTEKSRLDATLGNPIYLAIYVLFHIFVMLIILARRNASFSRNSFEYFLYGLLIPLHLFVLYFTATRGAGIGLVLGAIVASAGIAFSMRHHSAVRTGAIAVLLVALALVGTFYAARNTAFMQETPVLKRFATISLTEGTVYARTLVWQTAWQGIKERPLLGWGQENFNLVFNKYYDPRMYDQEQWFDRTHNVIFDWWIAAGLLGLLSYISIYLALLWTLYRTDAFTLTQKWLFVGLLVGYGFSLLTVFDNIVSYILFFSTLAWVYALTNIEGAAPAKFRIPEITNSGQKWALSVGALVIGAALVWIVNVGAYQKNVGLLTSLAQVATADVYAQRGNQDQSQQLLGQALKNFKEAEALSSFGTQEVHEQIGQAARQIAGYGWVADEDKQIWHDLAVKGFEQEIRYAPMDARPHVLLGNVHTAFSEYEEANEALESALVLSPNKPSILVALAANAINAGGFSQALPYAQQAFEVVPEYNEARALYALALMLNDRTEEALTIVREKPAVAGSDQIAPILIQYGKHDEAVMLWHIFTDREEVNVEDLYFIARAYVARGDRARAEAEISRLDAEIPELRATNAQVREELNQYFGDSQ